MWSIIVGKSSEAFNASPFRLERAWYNKGTARDDDELGLKVNPVETEAEVLGSLHKESQKNYYGKSAPINTCRGASN
jgi:hypothetical protein